jgi:hypothetical protein
MGALTAARVVILPERNLEPLTIKERHAEPLEKPCAASAEKSISRIENDDCTWLGVSG